MARIKRTSNTAGVFNNSVDSGNNGIEQPSSDSIDSVDGFAVEPLSGGNTGGNTGDTAGIGDAGRDSAGARRRGRPSGSSGNAKKTAGINDLDVGVLTGVLVCVNDIAAVLLKMPEFKDIDEEEMKTVAVALQRLQRYYPSVNVPGVVMAWVGLIGTGTKVYGPRIAAHRIRKNAERKSKETPKPPPIYNGAPIPDSVVPL